MLWPVQIKIAIKWDGPAVTKCINPSNIHPISDQFLLLSWVVWDDIVCKLFALQFSDPEIQWWDCQLEWTKQPTDGLGHVSSELNVDGCLDQGLKKRIYRVSQKKGGSSLMGCRGYQNWTTDKSWGCFGKFRKFPFQWAQKLNNFEKKRLRKTSSNMATPPEKNPKI